MKLTINSHFICLVFPALLAVCTGCYHATPASSSLPTKQAVDGQPSWFAIGPEVYHEGDATSAETEVLSVRPEPRWFVGFGKNVSKAEFDAYYAGMKMAMQDRADGGYCIPNPPPYPKRLEDVSLNDKGVTLTLNASAGSSPSTILLTLQLQSRDRALERQVEHRWTNTLPLLFAFYVDGHAVVVPYEGFGKRGGTVWMTPLVEKGGVRNWSIRVDEKSLCALLPDSKPHELSIAAAFANSQHQGYGGVGEALADQQDKPDEPILVRSKIVKLRWNGTAWKVTMQ